MKQRGVILLLAVLIMGAVALLIGVSITLASIWQTKSRINSRSGTTAKNLSDACVELTLQRIHDNTAFTGSGSITIGSNSCNYTVFNTGATTRRIESLSTVSDTTARLRVTLTVTTTIAVDTWQYVDSF